MSLGRAKEGGVVTGPDVHVCALAESLSEHRDQAELPRIREGGAGREGLSRGRDR